ncbi:hypothetical protein Droror1_Dr00004687 [Drosera rotundifolia]
MEVDKLFFRRSSNSSNRPLKQLSRAHTHTHTSHLSPHFISNVNLDRFGGVAVAAKADASIADLLNELGALNAQAGAKQTRSTVEDSAIPSQSRFWNCETKSMAILGA